MPTKYVTWRCNRCHSPHRSFEAAESCEYRHIVDDAVKTSPALRLKEVNREPVNKSPKERFK